MLKKMVLLVLLVAVCFAGYAQDKNLDKQARDEVGKALKEKRIGAMDMSKYYEMINKGKATDVIKELRIEASDIIGDVGFKPSEKKPVGWRGDGTGKYPNADPCIDFQRIAKSVKGMASSAKKPKGGPDSKAAPFIGAVSQWLVLGPIPTTEKGGEILDNPGIEPEENDKAGAYTWKLVSQENASLDFCTALNISTTQFGFGAYAHSYVYSPSAKPVAMNVHWAGVGTCKIWVNGTVLMNETAPDTGRGGRFVLPLKSGWNSLMIFCSKTGCGDKRLSWWTTCAFFGETPNDYEEKNIAWIKPMPSAGASAPVVVGDSLFATSENCALVCMSKKDGSYKWIRTTTYYDCVTDEEKKSKGAQISALDSTAASLRQADEACKSGTSAFSQRKQLEDQLQKGIAVIDPTKYVLPGWCESGQTIPTPITDGKYVYAVFASGIVACYDLEGKKIWAHVVDHTPVEHDYGTSPVLVDGKLCVYFETFNIFEAATGKVLVERPHYRPTGSSANHWYQHFFGTGAVITSAKEKVIYYMNGEFIRLADGKTIECDPGLMKQMGPGRDPWDNRISSPVVDNNMIYKVGNDNGGAYAFTLQTFMGTKGTVVINKDIPFNNFKFPLYYESFFDSSPLLYEDLMYNVSDMGILTVIDMKKGEVLYQKQLDVEIYMPYSTSVEKLKGGQASSPTLAGKYIFIFGNQGACVVIEPGRTFKQVAKLRLENQPIGDFMEHQEVIATNPVFEGNKMYLRGEHNMYCVGKK